jgi:hypothetical protein
MEGRTEGVNGLGIKDGHRQLKHLFPYFLPHSSHFTARRFGINSDWKRGRTNCNTISVCRDFGGEPSEKCKQITLECVY